MLVMVLLGVGCMIAGVLWGAWWVCVLLLWPRARGRVIGLDKGLEMGDFHPRIEFRRRDGEIVQFTSRFGVQFVRWWPVGRTVVVLYHPRNVRRAEVLLLSNAIVPLWVVLFGVLLILAGLFERGSFG